jgi:hypothetical protein
MSEVFISYSHSNRLYAHKLAEEIEKGGLSVFIDNRIDSSTPWPRVLQKEVELCAAFVVILTPKAYLSNWVQNELSFAQSEKKPIFPLLLEGKAWLSVSATQFDDVRSRRLPPASFYRKLKETVQFSSSPDWEKENVINEIVEALAVSAAAKTVLSIEGDPYIPALVAFGDKNNVWVTIQLWPGKDSPAFQHDDVRTALASKKLLEQMGWKVEKDEFGVEISSYGILENDRHRRGLAENLVRVLTRVFGRSAGKLNIL